MKQRSYSGEGVVCITVSMEQSTIDRIDTFVGSGKRSEFIRSAISDYLRMHEQSLDTDSTAGGPDVQNI